MALGPKGRSRAGVGVLAVQRGLNFVAPPAPHPRSLPSRRGAKALWDRLSALPHRGQTQTTIDAHPILPHCRLDCGRDWSNASAEGATAPETLRPTDRSQVKNSGKQAVKRLSEGATGAQPGNLSGQGQRGHAFPPLGGALSCRRPARESSWPKPIQKTSSRPRSTNAM